MKFNILLTGGLYDSQSGYTALKFCEAALSSGHTINQVFFYQHAVSQGSRLAVPMADEFDAPTEWVRLSSKIGIPLVVCVSAAERRGVISEEQRVELSKGASNLHQAFSVAGLGKLLEASLTADRTVTFK